MRIARSALLLGLACVSAIGQNPKPLEEQVQEIMALMGGPIAASKPRNIALLTPEERATLIRYYRRELEKLEQPETNPAAREIKTLHFRDRLLELGDPEVLAETVSVLLNAPVDSPEFQSAITRFTHAARVEAIPMLMPAIQLDEPLVMIPGGDVGALTPKSYGLSGTVLEIVARSPLFPEEVRTWAEQNEKVVPQNRLPLVRKWWAENEKALKEGDYKRVRPGEDLRAQELAAAAAIDARRQAYREELIASGKNPSDLANWQRYRDEVLPSLRAQQSAPAQPVSEPAQAPIDAGGKASEHVEPIASSSRSWGWSGTVTACGILAGAWYAFRRIAGSAKTR